MPAEVERLLLVTRPEGAAEETADPARRVGWTVISSPLLGTQPLDWTLPDGPFDALLLTSAEAVRHSGPLPQTVKALPLYAVGQRTADFARAGGLDPMVIGASDGSAIVARAAADGRRHILHLGAEEPAAITVPPGVTLYRTPVYRAGALPLTDEAVTALRAGKVAAVLLLSPRTAAIFAEEVSAHQLDRQQISLVAISENAAMAAGSGWSAVEVARTPTSDAALAAADDLWQRNRNG